MTPAAGPVRAFGRLRPDGPWVGFEPGPGGYRLVVGWPDGTIRADRTEDPTEIRDGLVAGAIGFYLATLTIPPSSSKPPRRTWAPWWAISSRTTGIQAWVTEATEALDAIDDGLAGDAVALRLQRLLPRGSDALEILRRRAASLSAGR